jgi:hypothetical protein
LSNSRETASLSDGVAMSGGYRVIGVCIFRLLSFSFLGYCAIQGRDADAGTDSRHRLM